MVEFSIASLVPGTQVHEVRFRFYCAGLQYDPPTDHYPFLEVYGYRGDGQVTVDDAFAPGPRVFGSRITSLGYWELSLVPEFLQTQIGQTDYAGFRFVDEIDDSLVMQLSIEGSQGFLPFDAPKLIVTYDVPEPVASVIFAPLGWLIQRRRVCR